MPWHGETLRDLARGASIDRKLPQAERPVRAWFAGRVSAINRLGRGRNLTVVVDHLHFQKGQRFGFQLASTGGDRSLFCDLLRASTGQVVDDVALADIGGHSWSSGGGGAMDRDGRSITRAELDDALASIAASGRGLLDLFELFHPQMGNPLVFEPEALARLLGAAVAACLGRTERGAAPTAKDVIAALAALDAARVASLPRRTVLALVELARRFLGSAAGEVLVHLLRHTARVDGAVDHRFSEPIQHFLSEHADVASALREAIRGGPPAENRGARDLWANL